MLFLISLCERPIERKFTFHLMNRQIHRLIGDDLIIFAGGSRFRIYSRNIDVKYILFKKRARS